MSGKTPRGTCLLFAVTISSVVPSCLVPSVSVEYRDTRAHTFAPDERQVIDSIVRLAVTDVRGQLNQLPHPILVMVQPAASSRSETGESATARLPNIIWWDVAPGAAGGVRAVAERELRASLIHQLCHWSGNGYNPNTLASTTPSPKAWPAHVTTP